MKGAAASHAPRWSSWPARASCRAASDAGVVSSSSDRRRRIQVGDGGHGTTVGSSSRRRSSTPRGGASPGAAATSLRGLRGLRAARLQLRLRPAIGIVRMVRISAATLGERRRLFTAERRSFLCHQFTPFRNHRPAVTDAAGAAPARPDAGTWANNRSRRAPSASAARARRRRDTAATRPARTPRVRRFRFAVRARPCSSRLTDTRRQTRRRESTRRRCCWPCHG
jgi:hypothetical protein